MTDRILTPTEVSQRTGRALLRVARILMDVRQTPGLYEDVKAQLPPGLLELLTTELAIWNDDDDDPWNDDDDPWNDDPID